MLYLFYNFREHVLAIFGLPEKFQSDNGGEFVNQTLQSLLDIWPGEVSIVHSRPRRPQVGPDESISI